MGLCRDTLCPYSTAVPDTETPHASEPGEAFWR